MILCLAGGALVAFVDLKCSALPLRLIVTLFRFVSLFSLSLLWLLFPLVVEVSWIR